jgi:hypothetical protein
MATAAATRPPARMRLAPWKEYIGPSGKLGSAPPIAAKGEKLKRLYRAIEDGIVDLDAHLKERIETLMTERDIAQASLDRIAIQSETRATITRDRLEAFSKLMREKLDTGDTRARKAYLQSVISQIEIDDDKVRIIGDKSPLAAVIAGRQNQTAQVRGFCRQVARPTRFELVTSAFGGQRFTLHSKSEARERAASRSSVSRC